MGNFNGYGVQVRFTGVLHGRRDDDNEHDSEAGIKKSKKRKKHKRVSGGYKILNTESSKVSEGSRRHEKSPLLYYKRTGKAWKRGYLLYEVKTDEDKGDETDEETSDTEEEIIVVKVCEWIDSLAKLWNRDPEYLDTGQNDDVKKEKKERSSKKVKLSMEDVKIDKPNAVSKFRITDRLREKLQATTFNIVLGGATNITARGLDINDVQLIIQCDVEDYINCSGRIGGAGNTGVVVMLYGSRKSGVSRIEKQAGKRFEHVSAPQPNDIAKAVGMEAAEKITQVCNSVVPAFMMAAGRRKLSASAPLDEEHGGNNAGGGKKSNKVTKRSGVRTTKKKFIAKDDPIEESSQFLVDSDDVSDSESDTKEPLRTRKKASPAASSSDVEEGKTEKKEALAVEATDADSKGEEIDLSKHESEDISHTYGWPPLVCCLGSAQHVFVPSGRPANRFLDCEFKTVEARVEAFHRKEEELKKELEIVKNQHASDSAVLLKMISIHAGKKETISDKEIAVLKSELEKARSSEAEVKERDKIIEKLDAEIEVFKMARSHAYGFADQWCNKAIEQEEQLEETNMMKKYASVSLVSLIKQLEGSNTRLQVMECEVTALKDKAKLMAKVEKEEIKLKTELETVKDEKGKTLSELERSKEEEEKSETAMQSLASALHQASSERVLKKRLLSLGGQDYETHVEDRKLVIKSTNEK
ncbi:BnaCnng47200D [Brassica napus]|uniref:BnaCnng47200D protein n=2 Tax=Brassica TaxID=3705 RepID=A0A078JCU1_BRANA|nr:BnaCnng47200D [Brassica napus]VDC94554.1 unnamed protein product [Brassica oleracea]